MSMRATTRRQRRRFAMFFDAVCFILMSRSHRHVMPLRHSRLEFRDCLNAAYARLPMRAACAAMPPAPMPSRLTNHHEYEMLAR